MTQSNVAVIKVGGAFIDRPTFLDSLSIHLERALRRHDRLVLVHGGGKEIGELHQRLDVPFRKEKGVRITSPASMELVTMVLCGPVNKRVVAHLSRRGIDALGVSGADYDLMRSELADPDRLGRVGKAPSVSRERLRRVLDLAEVLVLAPVCRATDGELVNVNADLVAQAAAVALDAASLDFVTDVEHVRTPEGPGLQLSTDDVERLVADAHIKGGMLPKLQAGVAALDAGVERVRVGNLTTLTRGGATEVRA